MAKSPKQLHLKVVSQAEELLSSDAEAVTVVTAEGEITVLPGHIPLFSQVLPGVLEYTHQNETHYFAHSKGFLDVSVDDTVTLIADTVTDARKVSEEKAQAAIEAAKQTMATSTDQRELIMAEASLKQAMLEIQVAQKSKKRKI